MSSNYYRGLSPVVTEHRRFINPCFFRKASGFSPLNCESALEKLSEFCSSHLGMPTKDIILQRSTHSRILLFTRNSWETLQQETKAKKNKNHNNEIIGEKSKQQERQNYSYSHNYSVKNLTAKSLFANNEDMFLFSGAPIAAFLPPPLLPFPVEKIDLWTGVVDEYRNVHEEKFITLEEYIQIVESARKNLQEPQQEQQQSETSSAEPNNNKDNNNKIQDLSGFLCVTRNQLSFVIADMGRNVLQGPRVAMKPMTADSDRADSELLPHFQADFWKNLAKDLLCSTSTSSSSTSSSSEFFDRVGSLWFRSERELAVPFFMNCCIPLQDGKNENQIEKQNVMELTKHQQLLRDDARWQRLPATVKSKKVPFDTDSLLRDSFYGQLQWYD